MKTQKSYATHIRRPTSQNSQKKRLSWINRIECANASSAASRASVINFFALLYSGFFRWGVGGVRVSWDCLAHCSEVLHCTKSMYHDIVLSWKWKGMADSDSRTQSKRKKKFHAVHPSASSTADYVCLANRQPIGEVLFPLGHSKTQESCKIFSNTRIVAPTDSSSSFKAGRGKNLVFHQFWVSVSFPGKRVSK